MNDGGTIKESVKDNEASTSSPHQQPQLEQEQKYYTRKPRRNDEFIRTISKISVAQICENEGFQGLQQSALEALSDVAIRYVGQLGKVSILYANLAGRVECNVFDLIQGLEDLDLDLVVGFRGASDFHHLLAKSGGVREIGLFVNEGESVPFVFDVPQFPVCREGSSLKPSFEQLGEVPPGEHIPGWLPAFPREEGLLDGKQEKGVEEVKKQPMVAKNELEGVMNPFLAPPLSFGETEVGIVEPPARFYMGHHGNGMERYGLGSDAECGKNEGFEIKTRDDVSVKLGGRPALWFKLSNKRKSLCLSNVDFFVMDEENGEESVEKVIDYVGMDEEGSKNKGGKMTEFSGVNEGDVNKGGERLAGFIGMNEDGDGKMEEEKVPNFGGISEEGNEMKGGDKVSNFVGLGKLKSEKNAGDQVAEVCGMDEGKYEKNEGQKVFAVCRVEGDGNTAGEKVTEVFRMSREKDEKNKHEKVTEVCGMDVEGGERNAEEEVNEVCVMDVEKDEKNEGGELIEVCGMDEEKDETNEGGKRNEVWRMDEEKDEKNTEKGTQIMDEQKDEKNEDKEETEIMDEEKYVKNEGEEVNKVCGLYEEKDKKKESKEVNVACGMDEVECEKNTTKVTEMMVEEKDEKNEG